MVPNNLLDALAAALDEDQKELVSGTTRRLPDCTKRQAFLLVLHQVHGLSTAQLAEWTGKGYSAIRGSIQTAQSYYDCADPSFFPHYQAAQEAYTTWLLTQPEKA